MIDDPVFRNAAMRVGDIFTIAGRHVRYSRWRRFLAFLRREKLPLVLQRFIVTAQTESFSAYEPFPFDVDGI
jgi:hypothetical protein